MSLENMPEEKPPPESAPPAAPQPPLGTRLVRYPREHPLGLLITVIVLAGAAVGGTFWWRYLQSYESTDDAFIDGHLNMVSSRVTGTIAHVYVTENQQVSAGQLLADLDVRDYQVELQRAQANLAQAQAQVRAENPNVSIATTTTQTGIASARAQLATAQASVGEADRERATQTARLAEARANEAKAQADLSRYTELVKKDEISRQEYDRHVAAAKAAEAEVAAQQGAVAAASKLIEARQAAVSQNRAELNQAAQNAPQQMDVQRANLQSRQAATQIAGAAVAQARLNLEYTKITAPIAGIVGRKSVEAGQRVQPGEPLISVVPLGDIWVTANLKENQVKRIRPGESVTIHVDAFDRDYEGYVESIAAASGAKFSILPPENATGNFVKVVQRIPVRLRFKPGQNEDHRLRPGMSVVPRIWLQ